MYRFGINMKTSFITLVLLALLAQPLTTSDAASLRYKIQNSHTQNLVSYIDDIGEGKKIYNLPLNQDRYKSIVPCVDRAKANAIVNESAVSAFDKAAIAPSLFAVVDLNRKLYKESWCDELEVSPLRPN